MSVFFRYRNCEVFEDLNDYEKSIVEDTVYVFLNNLPSKSKYKYDYVISVYNTEVII